MQRQLVIAALTCLALAGCDSLRFAPSEPQKQNAWLHERTAALTAKSAKDENTSEKLQALTKLSELQSRAFISYYGLPKEFPDAQTAEDILSQSNFELANRALTESAERPDGWQVADNAIELGIGILALLGGAYGVKAAQFLKLAKTKSKALQEIIYGNELFKKTNVESTEAFKQAQQNQSPETRQIVAEMKA